MGRKEASRSEGPRGGEKKVREHLANERTLLSWVRTGVGLISIGLVVERTGALVAASPAGGSAAASEVFGLALVALGMLTLVIGTAQFLSTRRRISAGDFVPVVAAYLVIAGGSLALAGAFVVYILFA